MIPRISKVRHTTGYKLALKFNDGNEDEIDLEGELWGEVFEPLKDQKRFKQVRLDRELNTICWDTGADFAPEFLYASITGNTTTKGNVLGD